MTRGVFSSAPALSYPVEFLKTIANETLVGLINCDYSRRTWANRRRISSGPASSPFSTPASSPLTPSNPSCRPLSHSPPRPAPPTLPDATASICRRTSTSLGRSRSRTNPSVMVLGNRRPAWWRRRRSSARTCRVRARTRTMRSRARRWSRSMGIICRG
jgi:hypothetical protein